MIRTATPADRDAIKDLWRQSFPEDPVFTDYYFRVLYPPLGQTLLDIESGTPAAMLRRIPRMLRCGCVDRRVTYIYGACTAPAFRRQGRMTRLLQASFEYDRAEDKIASILIPENPDLFAFYATLGYTPRFHAQTATFTRAPFLPQADFRFKRLSTAHIPDLDRLYQTCTADLDPVGLRTEADWREQIAFFGTLGCGVYGLFQNKELVAAAFLWRDGHAQEALSRTPALLERLSQHLMAAFELTEINLTTPGSATPFACLRPHTPAPLGTTGYLNLLFN